MGQRPMFTLSRAACPMHGPQGHQRASVPMPAASLPSLPFQGLTQGTTLDAGHFA